MYGTFAGFGDHQPLPRAGSCAAVRSQIVFGSQAIVLTKARR